MKKAYSSIAIIFFIAIIFSACRKNNNECVSNSPATISKVSGASSGTVNHEIDLKVSFTIINGCGKFGEFQQTTDGNTLTIQCIARYEGCICTQIVTTQEATYQFIPTMPGVYTLKFLNPDNSVIVHKITIE